MPPARPEPAAAPKQPETPWPSGVIAVDKPSGWTSFDVVAVVRKAVGVRRVGHGGTLDPLATGVLPILIGPATRFVEKLHGGAKVYAALVRFGTETTTDDAEGEVRRSAPPPDLDLARMDGALAAFRGVIQQLPPARSALKVGGRRAYSLDRAGEEVILAARPVRIDRLEAASWRSPSSLRLLVVCGSGTYVRALARDLGRAVGSAAHLGALRRLAVGALDAGEATTVEEVRTVGRGLLDRLRPADDRLLTLDPKYLSEPAERILGAWEGA